GRAHPGDALTVLGREHAPADQRDEPERAASRGEPPRSWRPCVSSHETSPRRALCCVGVAGVRTSEPGAGRVAWRDPSRHPVPDQDLGSSRAVMYACPVPPPKCTSWTVSGWPTYVVPKWAFRSTDEVAVSVQ